MILIQPASPLFGWEPQIGDRSEGGAGLWQLCSIRMGPLIPRQVGNTALIVFVSYFGSRVHRPRLIGYGAVLVALAGLLMSLPHFISEPYRYDRASPGKTRKGWAGDVREELHYHAPGPIPRPVGQNGHFLFLSTPSVPVRVGPSGSPGEWGCLGAEG